MTEQEEDCFFIPLAVTDDIDLIGEIVLGDVARSINGTDRVLCLHGTFKTKTTKGTLNEFKRWVDKTVQTLGPVYAIHYAEEGVKQIKLLKLLNFTYTHDTLNGQGVPCKVFERRN